MTNGVKLESRIGEDAERDAEKRLIRYLSPLFRYLENERDYSCFAGKFEVIVHEPETFNEFAKFLEVHNLKFLGGRLGFFLYVPKDNKPNHQDRAPNQWTILLNGDSNDDFLAKYRGAYEID